jgi:hypothetical protein
VIYLKQQAADDEVEWTVGVTYEDQGCGGGGGGCFISTTWAVFK